MPTPRLHDYASSANCLKVRILLGLLGIDYERVPVDIFGGETLTAAFAELNPVRTVPVLETADGRVLTESGAILWYLADGTSFLPQDAFARAQVLRWLLFEQADLVFALGGLRFRVLTGRLRPGEPEALRRAAASEQILALLEGELGTRPFLVGESCTIADLAVYAYTHVVPEGGVDLDGYPAVRAWIERVEAQPGFVDDLEPYPANARPGASRSIYDS